MICHYILKIFYTFEKLQKSNSAKDIKTFLHKFDRDI